MMRSLLVHPVAIAAAVACLAGCAPPVVSVEHVLPAALPMPGDVACVRADDFTVRSGPKDGFAAFMKDALAKHLMNVRIAPGHVGANARITEAQTARAGGTIDVEARDAKDARRIRRMNHKTGKLETLSLPTLVRTANVRVEFVVRRAGGKGPLGTVEVRRSYSSASDPLVRGALGLDRPDDPARVPPVDKIGRRLLTECIEGFGRMISPVVVKARVPLRHAPGHYAQLGLDAARKANYYEAVKQLAAAVGAAGNDANAHFDLAAVAEVRGELALAAKHYGRAWELSGRKDIEARAGADRTRRVLAARKPAAK